MAKVIGMQLNEPKETRLHDMKNTQIVQSKTITLMVSSNVKQYKKSKV